MIVMGEIPVEQDRVGAAALPWPRPPVDQVALSVDGLS